MPITNMIALNRRRKRTRGRATQTRRRTSRHGCAGARWGRGSSGGALQAPNSSTNPVLGISGQHVTLTNLTISGEVPRGRVPAMGRVETIPPRIDSSRSGDELIKEKSPYRIMAANGLGLVDRKRS